MSFVYKLMPSPVGELKLIANDEGLAAILWEDDDPMRIRIACDTQDDAHPILAQTAQQLQEYFAGKRKTFTVPLNFIGTPFQKKVWHVMMKIPYGQTRTYGQLAAQINHPTASRAVGAANGKNPISIIGPCHRVIGSSGKLTGYAGGLNIKQQLLQLERGQLTLI